MLAAGGHHQSFGRLSGPRVVPYCGRTATAQQKGSCRMPEVRSGEVNRRERDWLRSRAPLSISPIPFDLIASAAKKGPERVAGADIVRGQKGPVNDGSRSSTHNVSTGDVFQY
jgi:hypothetical protein